jgi:prephenate dehydratase/prephenate dehydrogenase
VTEATRPEVSDLIVVGAAAGMGRWLCDHLFDTRQWRSVTLIEQERSASLLTSVHWSFSVDPELGIVTDTVAGRQLLRPGTDVRVRLPKRAALVCLAIPFDQIASTARWLSLELHQEAVIFETTSSKVGPQNELRRATGGRPSFGLHPLFDSSARTLDGQTMFLTPSSDPRHQEAHLQLAALIGAQGGTVRVGSPVEHDQLMEYVQALPHKVLLLLLDALVASQINLDDLWEVRTPLFEAILGLAVRVMAVSNERSIASIQIESAESELEQVLHNAYQKLSSIVSEGSTDVVEKHISQLRKVFSGALFDAIRLTSSASVAAAQSKRAELSRRRRSGELTALRTTTHGRIRVGRVLTVTPLEVSLEEWLLGPDGHAALIGGPARANARKLGIGGMPKSTTFSLAHVELIVGDELEAALDRSLATVQVDVRFLVPESVAGAGILSIVAPHSAVMGARVLSEVVRTGQREVVAALEIRADYEVHPVVEELQVAVQRAYEWPGGAALPITGGHRLSIYYLGPPGTFSEIAAHQSARAMNRGDAEVFAMNSFDEVLNASVTQGVGVLPISSSASGLVTRSITSLSRIESGSITVGGVVDVAVRFDAYTLNGVDIDHLRGTPVFSHPQALSQCQQFIERLHLSPVPCASTRASIDQLIVEGRGVAITNSAQETDPRLQIVEREIDDLSGSITRFLLLGRADTFGHLAHGSESTLRSLWIGTSTTLILPELLHGGPAFDEILSDDAGNFLWVTSREFKSHAIADVVFLGRAPWTPRTPLVRVASSLDR